MAWKKQTSKAQSAKQSQVSLSREYVSGLVDYWSGRPRTAIEHLTKILADNPDAPDAFVMYRLWIEVLAEEGDTAALRSLGDHLRSRAEVDSEEHCTYTALRGMIHLERDELEATDLLLRGLNHVAEPNAYASELRHLRRQRTGGNALNELYQASVKGKLRDYFHWQTLARGLYIAGEESKLRLTVAKVKKLYPDSPLADLYSLQQARDRGDSEAAHEHIQALIGRFPAVTTYDVLGAIHSYEQGELAAAVQRLDRAANVDGEQDVDILSLRGATYAALFAQTKDPKARVKADHHLRRAIALLREQGLSAAVPSAVLNELDHQASQAVVEATERPRLWLVKLSARRFHELATTPEADVQYLCRPMSDVVAKGDICFFVGDGFVGANDNAGRSWRLGAVYTALSNPEWDALHGAVSMLQLVARLPVSVPIDVHELDRNLLKIGAKGHTRADASVFELDLRGLELVATAIEERLGADPIAVALERRLDRIKESS